MRCGQCQHWKSTDEWEASRAGFKECVAVRPRWVIADQASEGIPWGSGEDDWNEYDPDAAPPPNSFTGVRTAALRAERAYVQDGSEYRAELFTGPDFFCAKFTPLPRPVDR